MNSHETTLRELAGYLLRISDLYPRGSAMGQKQEAQVAACEAGADALRRGTWQPIATAPKDGTPILVADAKSVEAGVWQEATEDETECGVVTIPGFDAGWWGSEWQPGASQPTHWMPLPDAPTEPTR